eukprot:TRINITY_DN5384_c0_g1_i1.p1 TRINITY_DN5384_c0_g1~~TRINITY_DN5384_c0_g1_i1.p1  ORF type:complete len:558 (-),score=121.07 TRINITY_DN5384_c0_g1_i1:46-1719(-)
MKLLIALVLLSSALVAVLCVDCQSGATVSNIRDRNGYEKNFVQIRRKATQPYLEDFLGLPRNSLTNLTDKDYPHLGWANSGGGWRALLTDLGHHLANQNLTNSFTYNAGLSGGSWWVTSFADLYNPKSKFDFEQNMVYRLNVTLEHLPGGAETWIEILEKFYWDIPSTVPTSIMNVYGPVLASHFLTWEPEVPPVWDYDNNVRPVGIYERFSGKIRNNIETAQIPLPIVQASNYADLSPNTLFPNFFEFTPYESGFINTKCFAFIPTECFNNPFTNNTLTPTRNGIYQNGDNVAIIMGTSGSGPFALTFGQILVLLCEKYCQSWGCSQVCQWIAQEVEHNNNSEWNGRFYPGVFHNFLYKSNLIHGKDRGLSELYNDPLFYLVDSGVSQNIPFLPLLIRRVPIIFAVDASEPAEGGMPNGDALTSFQIFAQNEGYAFPKIPSEIDPVIKFPILPKALRGEPSIFGAGTKNERREKSVGGYEPIVVYLPLRRNDTLVPGFDPYFTDSHTLYTKVDIESMVKLNKGLMNEARVMDSIKCILLRYLNLDKKGCYCEICRD